VGKPKVSVITTTYNHPIKMIERAFSSVRNQHYKDYEHIFIDDTFTKNGMMETYRQALEKCTGKYITFCDGDDCWVDRNRLLKQVSYLDQNKDCGLCLTKVYTVIDDFWWGMNAPTDVINKNMTYDNLLKGNANIYAQSYMIRKSDFDKYIDFDKFLKFNVWDYPIVLELIRHTKFHTLDFYSAVYTKNKESVTNTELRRKRFKYVMGNYKIKLHYILKYGCELKTFVYLIYKFTRDLLSIGAKRWMK